MHFTPKFTDQQIKSACRPSEYHQHPDCVRIAVQWLAAQRPTKGTTRTAHALKHIIESWGERYVSADDVRVAARLLGIRGQYPHFSLHGALTLPDSGRLIGCKEAGKHKHYGRRAWWCYRRAEWLHE